MCSFKHQFKVFKAPRQTVQDVGVRERKRARQKDEGSLRWHRSRPGGRISGINAEMVALSRACATLVRACA